MAKKEKKAQVIDQTHLKKRSQLKSVWLRFKKNKLAMVGLGYVNFGCFNGAHSRLLL